MKIVTFANVLQYNIFPLAEILNTLLDIGQREMNNHVEIEFAVNMDVPEGEPMIFSFLQIRPVVEFLEKEHVKIEQDNQESSIIISNSALGNGVINDLHDIIYVKQESFDALNNTKIASLIEQLNLKMLEENRKYILVGPGRWGSRIPSLGIPVKWSQISEARLIVEAGLDKYRIEASQGTHFFQNLTSFHVGYFSVNPYINDGFYNIDYLSSLPAIYEDDYIRHVQLAKPVIVKIDGRKSKGVVLKNN